jgi:Domain of unknown function (DUF6048)
LKFIFRILLVVLPVVSASAQNPEPDSTASPPKKADTLKHSYRPTGIRFGTDVISIIRSYAYHDFKGWELNGDIDFYRYFLTVDYGSWSRNATLDNGYYQNKGTYFRIGTDINFLLKDPDHNMFFLGFRYGHSTYDESMNYSYVDPVYGLTSRNLSASGVKGNWGELTTGLRVKIWKAFWMGYTARLKFVPSVTGGNPELKPYDIPGYGVAQKAPWWGFNYQIFWRVPVSKAK